MPVRSSSSSVLRWPDASRVRAALAAWARERGSRATELLRVGYFGSYARGDWGPGSDLDVVLVVARSDRPFIERGSEWDLTSLPVPAQTLVYTTKEWARLQREGGRFATMLGSETVWVWERTDRRSP